MRIKQVIIKNFMSYVDVDIPISTSDGDVAVFQAPNGHGKSNFFLAIRWCLYGDKHKDVGQIAEKDLFNRKAWRTKGVSGGAQASVSLTFDYFGEEYQITRTLKADADGTISRDHSIKKNGQPRAKQDFDDIVNGMIPEKIKEFFFYDGESQSAFIALVNGDREDVRVAVRELLSTPLISEARDAVRKRETAEIRRQSAYQADSNRARILRNSIDELQGKIDTATSEINEWRNAFEQAAIDKEHYEALAEKHEAFSEASSRRKEALAELKTIKEMVISKKMELINLQKNAFWLPCSDQLLEAKNNAMADQSLYATTLRSIEILKKQYDDWSKMADTSICPTCKQEHGISQSEITSNQKALEEQISVLQAQLPIDPAAQIVNLSRIGFRPDLKDEYTQRLSELRTLQTSVVTADNKYRAANIKVLEFNADEEEVRNVVQNHLEANNKFNRARDKHREASDQKAAFVEQLNSKVDELQRVSPGDDLTKKIDFIRAISEALTYGEENYLKNVVSNLQSVASETFCGLVGGYSGIEIAQDFSIKAILVNGEEDRGINHGHRKQMALALVHSMLRIALNDPFILMDSPETSLDPGLARGLFTWVGNSKFAMSLFLIPEEGTQPDGSKYFFIKQEYLDLIGTSLANHYQIVKVDEDESKIIVFTDGKIS